MWQETYNLLYSRKRWRRRLGYYYVLERAITVDKVAPFGSYHYQAILLPWNSTISLHRKDWAFEYHRARTHRRQYR